MNLVSELFLEEFPAPILLVNKNSHCIEYVNNQLKSFVATHPNELIGKCFSEWTLQKRLTLNGTWKNKKTLRGPSFVPPGGTDKMLCATLAVNLFEIISCLRHNLGIFLSSNAINTFPIRGTVIKKEHVCIYIAMSCYR